MNCFFYRSTTFVVVALLASGCATIQQKFTQISQKYKPVSHQLITFTPLVFPNQNIFAFALPKAPLPLIQPLEAAIITNETNPLGQEMVEFAKKHLGIRYRYAGHNPKYGFDCSGFTSFVASNFGYNLSPACSGQSVVGEEIPLSEVQKGDLLFFGYARKTGKGKKKVSNYTYISHVSMVASNKGETMAMIHAARRGIAIDDINSGSWRHYYAPRFLFAKRITSKEQIEKLRNPIFWAKKQ